MTTPMRRQYLAIKKQYPDVIVLFRLGDFYETFDDDAKTVADVCDIVLTSRPVGKNQRVPLAGVPYHAADSYIAKLIRAGYKVAIAEQMDATAARGLVRREVRRIVTPGTLVEPGLLEERRNNYLATILVEEERAGLAYADITTGEFATTQFEGQGMRRAVGEELARLQPAEVVFPEVQASSVSLDQIGPLVGGHHRVSAFPVWRFDLDTARQALLDHFGTASLAGYGCERQPLAVRAAGALVAYLGETQPDALTQLVGLRTYSTSEYMTLDEATWRNLELVQTIRSGSAKGSLLGVLDVTKTAMGSRLLRRWLGQPLLDVESVRRRQDGVEQWFGGTPRRLQIRELLRGCGDLERWITRVVQRIAGPRDLVGIRESLRRVPGVAAVLQDQGAADARLAEDGSSRPSSAADISGRSGLDPCADVLALLESAVAEDPPATLAAGGVIRLGYSAELDGITAAARDAKQYIAGLERAEKRRTGIKSLKVGYNKVFGYYIEVSKANEELVPGDYIRKQTLVNAERYITPELKEYESLILNAQERLLDLESQLFREVVERVADAAPRVNATAQALAELDVTTSLADVAADHRYVRPVVADDDRLDIVAGRHPVVELLQRDEPFQPNDVHLSSDEAVVVLTGPNMSGKSTYLRQVALIVLMAQIGSFVPADEAHIGVVDRIFTRIGAADEIASGRSTFMVEMVETANILHHATNRSLLILDEIGRGTSTYDGLSIAWAVVEHIHNHPRLQAKTLFATHYHELTELADMLPRVCNYNVAVAEEGESVVFLHQIVRGSADRSYGIHVAELAGLPRPVLQRAREILKELESKAPRGPLHLKPSGSQQLPLFLTKDPVVEELRSLDVSQMTPLEAISKLYELQQKVKEGRV